MSGLKVGDRIRIARNGFFTDLLLGEEGQVADIDTYGELPPGYVQYRVVLDRSPDREVWFNPYEIEKISDDSE